MSRTVAAMYDSRAEAEVARARLISELGAGSPRIIGKDTAGAVDGLKFQQKDADSYREALRRGGQLLVAQVPSGTSAKRVVELLKSAIGKADEPTDQPADAEQGVQVDIPAEERAETAPRPSIMAAAAAEAADVPEKHDEPREPAPEPIPQATAAAAPIEEQRIPVVREELRIGKREVARGGARVRSFTRETPAEERVVLRDESMEVENRPSERHLTESEIEAGGLFQERVFEIAEMREEPVVTKVAVVREEVIVRKRVTERTETIRDTVRHTEIEVEDLPA